MSPLALFFVFLRAAALSFGGQGALPLLREDLVNTGVLSEGQVLEALAIGRIAPGPTGLYIVSLGYFAYGVAGDVTPFAYGVVGDVDPFAHGVVGQVEPFAGDLTDTVRSTGGPLAGHAVTGVQGVTESITPGYVQNAHLGSTYSI